MADSASLFALQETENFRVSSLGHSFMRGASGFGEAGGTPEPFPRCQSLIPLQALHLHPQDPRLVNPDPLGDPALMNAWLPEGWVPLRWRGSGVAGGGLGHQQGRGGCLEDMPAVPRTAGSGSSDSTRRCRPGAGACSRVPAVRPGCSSLSSAFFLPWMWPPWVMAGLRKIRGASRDRASPPPAGPQARQVWGRGP